MELQFLGTGAGVPAKFRNVTSIALKLVSEINEVWLFDAGEGTQMQVLRTSIRPRKISKIFITHLHGDHLFGLPGLLGSRSFQGGEEGVTPLDLYGPAGIEEFVETTLRVSDTRLNYQINYHELDPHGGLVFEDDNFTVTALPLRHGVLSFGFRIVEADLAGELQADKLIKLGVPNGPLFGQLKRGETITLANGTVINGADYIGEQKKGRVVAIMGDTRPSDEAIILAKDADVLVHEATFDHTQSKIAHEYFHTTTVQAAEIAKKAQVRKLILTHYSARYQNYDLPMLREQAQEVFPNTITVQDLDEIKIPLKK